MLVVDAIIKKKKKKGMIDEYELVFAIKFNLHSSKPICYYRREFNLIENSF